MNCTTLSLLSSVGLLASLLASSQQAQAQLALRDSTTQDYPEVIQRRKVLDSMRIMTLNGKPRDASVTPDSVESLMEMFYTNQFRHFQDPQAPYLMFMSNDANFAMGISGTIRMRGWYDWNGSIQTNGFCPYLIDIPAVPTQMHRLAATPAGTTFAYTAFGRNTRLGNFIGYIEAGFNGYDNINFKLKKAYVTLNDWTVGYASTTFSDDPATPPTIDGQGPNGESSRTNVLVRYMHNFNKRFTLAASLEFPKSQIKDDDKYTKPCNDYIPDVAAFLQYQWSGGASHVRLSGLARVMEYRDLVTGKNHNVFGWGVKLSSVIKVLRPFNLFAQVNYGKGHSSYINDVGIANFDLISEYGHLGEMYAPESLGVSLGTQYFILPNLFSCIVVSENAFHPKHNPSDDTYKYGLYGAFNVFWNITSRMQVGAEYLIGKKMEYNGLHKCADRIDALFQLSF